MHPAAVSFKLPTLPKASQKPDEDGEEYNEGLLAARESSDLATASLALGRLSSGKRHCASTSSRLLKRIGLLSFYLVILLLALNGLYHLVRPYSGTVAQYIHWPGSLSQDDLSCSCGDSIAEALTRSCRYDTLSAAWLPPHCRDDELTARFDAAGPGDGGAWTYYADQSGNSTMTLAEIAQLPGNDTHEFFYMTYRWHVFHCSFYWRKLHRMVHGVEGAAKRIEYRSDSESHIDHCEGIFTLNYPLDAIATGSGVSLNADRIPNIHE
ncbi:hypothetical protein AnigIFM60653_000193 [Aspergillus niger]|nr:hypothetical protein AnigIFM60653_000193 [Aspergillus niger]